MTKVTVIGAGVAGLTLAYVLAQRGADVIVQEAAPALGGGASGGNVGALSPHVPELWNPKKAFQLASLLRARTFWQEVAQDGGHDSGYAPVGRLQPLTEATLPLWQERVGGAARLWPPEVRLEIRALSDLAGRGWLLPQSDSGFLAYDTLSARINPRQALRALAAAAESKGAEFCFDRATPSDFDPAGRVVVWATGASPEMARNFGITGVKGQSALVKYTAAGPQVFAQSLHIVPHQDGTVAIGSTSERRFEGLAPDERLDALIDTAARICPQLAGAEVVDRWAGLRPRAPSRAPLAGRWPGRAGHFVLNGGFKIGFGMAPGLAEAMARLILDGENTIPPEFWPVQGSGDTPIT